jgi:hypothetical protein
MASIFEFWLTLCFLVAGISVFATPSLQDCKAQYGNLSYSPTRDWSDETIPPLLLSYPGSGNTYLRAVIEYATSLYSGSIYLKDRELMRTFPGEEYCSRSLSIIKGHPTDLMLIQELDSQNKVMASRKGDKRVRLRLSNRQLRSKCVKGNVKYWTRVVLLVRDPYSSILSDAQRFMTNSHVGTVKGFNVTLKRFGGRRLFDVWVDRSFALAKEYSDSFGSLIVPLTNRNASATHGVSTLHVANFNAIIKDKASRERALAALMREVYPRLNVTAHKLACAFVLADSHRGVLRKGVMKLDPVAMYSEIDPHLPCKLEPFVGPFARNFSFTASPNPNFPSVEEQCKRNRTQ